MSTTLTIPKLEMSMSEGTLAEWKVEDGATVKEGDVITFGPHKLTVLHTPGHTPGGISLVMDNSPLVYVGDTLFAGSIGRTDLWGGDFDAIEQSIRERLYTLDDTTVVVTGHGPETAIGWEKESNQFIRVA